MVRPRRNSLIIPILRYLSETTPELLRLGVRVVVDPWGLVQEVYYSYEKPPSGRELTNRATYLRRSKYFKKTKGSNAYELTSEGRVAVIRVRILDKAKKVKKEWDGMYRAISFDILEARRRDRALLRQELRALGLIELHHSLWITPVDITAELLALLKLWRSELAGDVRVFLIKELHEDKDLRGRFGLS